MLKKYQSKKIKSINLLLITITILTTIFLSSCSTDPKNLNVWYLAGFTINGQSYSVRDIYNQDYVNSDYMTISFEDGKVEFNRNGTIIKGTYTYKDNIGCGSKRHDNNEVVVKLDNGVIYKGSSHVYAFDGKWYKLELKNESETLNFCDNKDDHYFSGVNDKAYTALQEIKYYRENFNDLMFAYKITNGEQEKIIEDVNLVYNFLENLNGQIAYPYQLVKEDLTKENNFNKYTFQILQKLDTDPISYNEGFKVSFYYNSETNFFYEIADENKRHIIDGKTVYTDVECISGKEKSLYKCILEIFNEE